MMRNGGRANEAGGSTAEAIAGHLRSEIVAGKLLPGSQLPTRMELKNRFRSTSVTVQRALDRLMQEEFVYSNGRRGTYVTEAPPHLSRYALVFPHHPSNQDQWRRFWTALSNEAKILEQLGEGHQLPLYHQVNAHGDSADYTRLMQEVRSHRVAGMIFASPPFDLLDTPLLQEPGIPRVGISRRVFDPIPTVDLDLRSYVAKALDYVQSQGRKHVAVIIPATWTLPDQELWAKGLAERGMDFRPYWIQNVHLSAPVSARGCAHLLMNPDQRQRPDALIVVDDNLVEHAMAGLLAAGVSAPHDVLVIAHCNFPWSTPSILPTQRLGFDAREVLNACVDSIDRQRRGESVPAQTSIRAVFEEELAARQSTAENRVVLQKAAAHL